jgi:hypothetical protein
MSDTTPPPCDRCPPNLCAGPDAHALHEAILALPLPPQHLAAMVHMSLDQLRDPNTFWFLHRLRALSLTALDYIASMTGHTIAEAAHIILATPSSARNQPPPGAPAQLLAVLLATLPAGCTPTHVADRLAWTLPAVHAAVASLRDAPPPGLRLHLTVEGTLTLRADPAHLAPTPDEGDQPERGGETGEKATAPPDSPEEVWAPAFALEFGCAIQLWDICRGNATAIRRDDIESLTTAGLLVSDGHAIRVATDVAYSLQWYSSGIDRGNTTP